MRTAAPSNNDNKLRSPRLVEVGSLVRIHFDKYDSLVFLIVNDEDVSATTTSSRFKAMEASADRKVVALNIRSELFVLLGYEQVDSMEFVELLHPVYGKLMLSVNGDLPPHRYRHCVKVEMVVVGNTTDVP